MRGRADIVLVDASAAPERAMRIALSAHVDAIVVVVRLKALQHVGARGVGMDARSLRRPPSSVSSSPATRRATGYGIEIRAAARNSSPRAAARRRLTAHRPGSSADAPTATRGVAPPRLEPTRSRPAGPSGVEPDGRRRRAASDEPPRHPRSHRVGRFGGLSPREAELTRAQSRSSEVPSSAPTHDEHAERGREPVGGPARPGLTRPR